MHEAGSCFAYLLTEGWGPYLDVFSELDVDLFWGLDPDRNGASMERIKEKIGGVSSILGGVSSEQDVDMGTPERMRVSVRNAIDALAPGGGFILAPSVGLSSVGLSSNRQLRKMQWDNITALIDEAHKAGIYKK